MMNKYFKFQGADKHEEINTRSKDTPFFNGGMERKREKREKESKTANAFCFEQQKGWFKSS